MKINKESISVVIPMYNSKDSIISTLEYINNQTYSDFIKEIIVVNDGSKDNSEILVKEYSKSSNIKLILINKENGGVSTARNLGLSKAKGEWVAFCDSDDVWLKDKIENQVNIINNHTENIDFLGGNYTDKTQYILLKSINKLKRISVKELCIKTIFQTSTVLMKKSIYLEIGGFDEKQRYVEDANFFLKIAAKYDLYYSPIQMVIYGGGKRGFGGTGLSGNLKGMQDGCVKNLNDMLNLGYINHCWYVYLRLFYFIKYVRRITISYLSNIKEQVSI